MNSNEHKGGKYRTARKKLGQKNSLAITNIVGIKEVGRMTKGEYFN